MRLIAPGTIRCLLRDGLQSLHSSADKANCRAMRGQGQSDRLADSTISASNHSDLIGELCHRPEVTVILELLSASHGAATGRQRHELFRTLSRCVRQYPTGYDRHPTGSTPITSRFPGAFRRDFRPLRGIALGGLTAARISGSDCSNTDYFPKRKRPTNTSQANAQGWPDPLAPNCRQSCDIPEICHAVCA